MACCRPVLARLQSGEAEAGGEGGIGDGPAVPAGALCLWNARGTPSFVMRHEGSLISTAFSPDGKRLLTSAMGPEDRGIFKPTAYLWDPAATAIATPP